MRLAIVAFSLGTVAACSGDPHPGPDAAPPPRATWYQDVAPIVAEHCMGCHQDGGIAPFSLTEYADAKEYAAIMLYNVEHGIMPPWDAVDGDDCAPRYGWKDDPRLSDDELETLRWWVEDGTAEGEPDDVPEPPTIALEGITHSVQSATGYRVEPGADQFICFVLDPGLTEDRYLNGIQLRPGNPEVVHHTVTWALAPGATQDAVIAASGLDQPFECEAGAQGLADSKLIHVWTPGNQPMVTPDELGIELKAGSVLITQYHYHPHPGATDEPDASTLELRLTAERPDKLYVIGAWGNASTAPELLDGAGDRGAPEFFIPAGAADHEEAMRFTIDLGGSPLRFPLFAAYPHMHYVGVGLQVTITRATPAPEEPTSECLVNVDRWNFDWQRTYQYDAPIDTLPTVGHGDIIDIECSYDNTLDNPFVMRALEDQGLTSPIDITLGEQTLDEMCLGIFGIAFDAPAANAPAFSLTPMRIAQ